MLEAMHSVHDATMGLQELNLDDAVAPISAIVLDQVLCELSGSFVNTFGGFGVFHNTVSRADANDDVVDDAALKQAAIEEVASVFNDSDESLARYHRIAARRRLSATMSDELVCMLQQAGLSPSPPTPRLQSIIETSDDEDSGVDENSPFALYPALPDYDDLDLTDDDEAYTTPNVNEGAFCVPTLPCAVSPLALQTPAMAQSWHDAVSPKRVLFPPKIEPESPAKTPPPPCAPSTRPRAAASLRPAPTPSVRRSRPVSPPRSSTPTSPGSPARKRRTRGASTSPKHAHGRNHVCMFCGARFLCKSKLDRHALIHTGDRPFPCFCGKNFNQKSALKNHTRRHVRKCDPSTLNDIMHTGLNNFSYLELTEPAPGYGM